MAEKIADLVPGPQGKFIGLMVDEAKKTIFDNIKAISEDHARDDADTGLVEAKNMFTDITVATMMRHGLFGDGSVPAQTHPYHYKDYSPGVAGHFMDHGKITPRGEMNAEQLRAYEEWLGVGDVGRVLGQPGNAIGDGFEDVENYYAGHGS
jgi:hypothetical protein